MTKFAKAGIITALIGAGVIAVIIPLAIKAKSDLKAANKYTAAVEEIKKANDELQAKIDSNEKFYEEYVEESKINAAYAEAYRKELDSLMEIENKSNADKAKIQFFVDELNDLTSDLLIYDEEADKLYVY